MVTSFRYEIFGRETWSADPTAVKAVTGGEYIDNAKGSSSKYYFSWYRLKCPHGYSSVGSAAALSINDSGYRWGGRKGNYFCVKDKYVTTTLCNSF